MSKFAKIPVNIPEAVQVVIEKETVKVSGPKGSLERRVPKEVKVENKDGLVMVKLVESETKFGRAIVGTIRSHIINMIKGVTEGWTKKLELVGTGYRAEVRGNDLVLTIGYSHPVVFKAPQDVKFRVEKNVVSVEGADREGVTQLAAKIRDSREPDPYKGKGVRYLGEILKLRPGKQAAKTTT